MTDTSKRIDVGSTTLFQLGFDALIPNDNKAYGLKRGDNGKMSAKLVELSDNDTVYTAGAGIAISQEHEISSTVEGLAGTAADVEDLAANADLVTAVAKINALLAALRTRGVLAAPTEE